MTDSTKDKETAERPEIKLMHLSGISLIPLDIVSVQWDMIQEFSKKKVTKIKTKHDVFILEFDLPHYAEDVQALKIGLGY